MSIETFTAEIREIYSKHNIDGGIVDHIEDSIRAYQMKDVNSCKDSKTIANYYKSRYWQLRRRRSSQDNISENKETSGMENPIVSKAKNKDFLFATYCNFANITSEQFFKYKYGDDIELSSAFNYIYNNLLSKLQELLIKDVRNEGFKEAIRRLQEENEKYFVMPVIKADDTIKIVGFHDGD
jgi:hypothetical protein